MKLTETLDKDILEIERLTGSAIRSRNTADTQIGGNRQSL